MSIANIDHTVKQTEPQWQTHTKIKNASWLHEAPTEYLISLFRNKNLEMMFVGGCVRNSMLGIDSYDLDIATTATPDEVIQMFEESHIQYDNQHKQFGIIIATIDHRIFEIATLRKDVYYNTNNSRYPDEIHFIKDWLLDAHRRDFTCNAIYCDPDGNLYDPFNGLQDIKESTMRFIGNAEERITEDPLRILRFFRFYTLFNIKNMSYFTEKIIKNHAELLSNISQTILFKEMRSILSQPNIIALLSIMDKTKILQHVLGIANPDLMLLREVVWLEKRASILSGILPDPIRRLGALVSFDYELSHDLVIRLNLNHDDMTNMLFLSKAFHEYDLKNYDEIFQVFGHILDLSHMRHLILIGWAVDRAYSPPARKKSANYWLNVFAKLSYTETDNMPVIKNKILTIGFSKGYLVGKTIKKLELERCKKTYKKGKERLTNYIEKYT